MKEIFILGGPNGAGKTTAARVLLPSKLHAHTYINADEIARRVDPSNPDGAALAAGRIMLQRVQELIATEVSFAFETTCAGRVYLRLLENCKLNGWKVSLIYLWIPSPEYALARVERRVRQGGHSIPEDVIRRRYKAGLFNMHHLYLSLGDDATIYDNRDSALKLIARREAPYSLQVWDGAIWASIEEKTRWKP
ncbi:MAG: zeta toxin family protein [Terracidiphilus sp.]